MSQSKPGSIQRRLLVFWPCTQSTPYELFVFTVCTHFVSNAMSPVSASDDLGVKLYKGRHSAHQGLPPTPPPSPQRDDRGTIQRVVGGKRPSGPAWREEHDSWHALQSPFIVVSLGSNLSSTRRRQATRIREQSFPKAHTRIDSCFGGKRKSIDSTF